MVSTAFRIDLLHDVPRLAKESVDRLIVKLDKIRGTGEKIDLAEEFRHLTLQVIAEAILSIDPEEASSTFAEMYLPIVTEGNIRTWYPHRNYLPNLSYSRHVKELNDYITKIITNRWEERQKQGVEASQERKPDILDRVLSSIDPSEWGHTAIRRLRDQVRFCSKHTVK